MQVNLGLVHQEELALGHGRFQVGVHVVTIVRRIRFTRFVCHCASLPKDFHRRNRRYILEYSSVVTISAKQLLATTLPHDARCQPATSNSESGARRDVALARERYECGTTSE
jgi:hypothetical protein